MSYAMTLTLPNLLLLSNLCKHWSLFTLLVEPLKINYQTSELIETKSGYLMMKMYIRRWRPHLGKYFGADPVSKVLLTLSSPT